MKALFFISIIIASILTVSLSVCVSAKDITDERSLTVPQGGKESFTVEIISDDNGALIYDMTVDASEGDITVYTPDGTVRDTVHFTQDDRTIHRYMPASKGIYTIEITRTGSSTGSGDVNAVLTYEGNSHKSLVFRIVDSIKAVIITLITVVISIVGFIFRFPLVKWFIYGGAGGGMNSYRSSYYDVKR